MLYYNVLVQGHGLACVHPQCSTGDTVSATTSSSSTSSTSSSTSSTTSVAWVYCHGIDLYDQCYGWYCNGPPNPSCPSGCPTCTYYTCGTGSFGGGSVDYQQTDCGSYTTSTIATVSSLQPHRHRARPRLPAAAAAATIAAGATARPAADAGTPPPAASTGVAAEPSTRLRLLLRLWLLQWQPGTLLLLERKAACGKRGNYGPNFE